MVKEHMNGEGNLLSRTNYNAPVNMTPAMLEDIIAKSAYYGAMNVLMPTAPPCWAVRARALIDKGLIDKDLLHKELIHFSFLYACLIYKYLIALDFPA